MNKYGFEGVRGAGQAVCKPGSVPHKLLRANGELWGGDHSSGAVVTQLPRCDLPERRPENGACRIPCAARKLCCRDRRSFLPGLASGGVYNASAVTSAAVGSYPTLSPLPRIRFGAVCFLWHFP
jgi:hypothetical protein